MIYLVLHTSFLVQAGPLGMEAAMEFTRGNLIWKSTPSWLDREQVARELGAGLIPHLSLDDRTWELGKGFFSEHESVAKEDEKVFADFSALMESKGKLLVAGFIECLHQEPWLQEDQKPQAVIGWWFPLQKPWVDT